MSDMKHFSIGLHNSRAYCVKGAGWLPQRNKGGGRRPGDIRGGSYPVAFTHALNKPEAQ